MRVQFNGVEVTATVIEEKPFISPHTGVSLLERELEIVLNDRESHDRLVALLHQEESVAKELDEEGTILSKWKVGSKSYHYTEGTEEYVHVLRAQSLEELNIQRLILGDLALVPYEYSEEFRDGAIFVEVKVRLSEEEYSRLKELMGRRDYFAVIREGISDEPREMRFGKTRWSHHGDFIKHEIYLVERTYDESEPSLALFDPEMGQMQRMTAQNLEETSGLFATLLGKGILSAQELEEIKREADRGLPDRLREFFRVNDIDEF